VARDWLGDRAISFFDGSALGLKAPLAVPSSGRTGFARSSV